LATTAKRARSLAEAQRFADRYRTAAPADGYADVPDLHRALRARAIEVELLRKRRAIGRLTDGAILGDYRRRLGQHAADHARFPEFNASAYALLEAWIDGNQLLNKYPRKDCLVLLRAGLARLRDGSDEPSFAKETLAKAARAAGDLAACKEPPAGEDDSLAAQVASARETWQAARQLMEKVNDRSDGPGQVRAVADLADILIRAGGQRVADEARSAALRLCEKYLPPAQPLDGAVLIDGQPVPRARVAIVWGDARPDTPLGAAGPKGETCDEFWLKALAARGKAGGIDVRFRRAGEADFARRAPDKVAPTPQSQAARAYNEARRALLEGRWTPDLLKELRDQCGQKDDRPPLPEALDRTLDAILTNPSSFFP
jgi:hypothetical protein